MTGCQKAVATSAFTIIIKIKKRLSCKQKKNKIKGSEGNQGFVSVPWKERTEENDLGKK